jgi:hypothetical protein
MELVCAGVRGQRSLEEVLAVDARTVRYYRQAAAWLALIDDEDRLTPTLLGLEVVYRPKHRKSAWSRAVWATPFVARIMDGRAAPPTLEEVTQEVLRVAPELSAATARRKASAIRAWINVAGPRQVVADQQLELPLSHPTRRARALAVVPLDREADPDVYRFLLRGLLDYGELGLGHLRALLDDAGVPDQPIGAYVDLAITRGDAWRVGDRLVASAGAVARRGLLGATSSIILSHAPFRELIEVSAAGLAGDPAAAARARGMAPRLRSWSIRLFGRALDASEVPAALAGLIVDRRLAGFPVAQPEGAAPVPVDEGFAFCWRTPGQFIAVPPSLEQVERGLPAITRALEQARTGAADSGMPGVALRPLVVHSGILHPGERLPRSVPDGRSLRLRLLLHAPYPAMVAAVLLAHRSRPDGGAIVMTAGWQLVVGGKPVGDLLDALDAFAVSVGHVPVRNEGGRESADRVVRLLETLGVATVLGGDTLVMSERFFAQTKVEAEEMEVAALLGPLGDAIAGCLAGPG